MKKGKISKKDKEKILELFVDDIEIEDIAKQVDRSLSSVNKYLQEVAAEEAENETVTATVQTKEKSFSEVEIEDIQDPGREAPKAEKPARRRPSNVFSTKTGSGHGGVAVSNSRASEKVDEINKKISRRDKPHHPATYSIYND